MTILRGAFFAFLIVAAAAGARAAEPDLVVAALKGPSGIGMARLFDSPPRLPDGGQVRMLAVSGTDVVVAKLVSGEYDAAALPINMAAKLYSAGIPLRLAAIVGEGMVSFLSSDPGIGSMRDLEGKRVLVAGQGATPDYLFRKLLADAGLDPSRDLRLDYSMTYPEAAMALAGGMIDNAVLPEPFSTMALAANPGLRSAIDIGELWTASTGQASYPMTAFVVSARAAAARPDALRALLDAYRASIDAVKADPEGAGMIVERRDLGLKAATAAAAIPRSALVFIEAPLARPAIEALLAVFLAIAPASVGGKLPDAGFYASFR